MSKPVSLTPPLPYPSFGRDLQELSTFDRDLVKSLVSYLSEVGLRLNGSLPKNGTEAMEGDLNMNGFDIVDVGNFVIDGPAGTARIITFTTGDSTRWVIAVDNTPETGSNAGSDFAIYRYSDTGVFLGQAFYIQRSTGDIYAENDVNVAGDTNVSGDVNVTGDVGGATATITGNATVGGDLGVTGRITDDNANGGGGDTWGGRLIHLANFAPSIYFQDKTTSSEDLLMGIDGNALRFYSTTAGDGSDLVQRLQLSLTSGLLTLNGGQIAFPATQAPSTNVNTLDDYEEGTFTPTISFGGGSTGVTYGVQEGTYTKIGKTIIFQLRLQLTSNGTSTGAVSIEGPPFDANNATALSFGAAFGLLGLTGTPSAYIDNASNNIRIRQWGATGSSGILTDTSFSDTADIYIAGSYQEDV